MLEVDSISHQFGAVDVLRGVDLTVAAGEIVCLLGASGSGKSTLLRIIAGLEPLQTGRIGFNGKALAQPGAEPPAEQRRFGMVFQDHVLFPHMTVGENVRFGLSDLPPDQARARVQEQLALVGLADLAERYPHTLSGGQQQRVALARALAPQPLLMLLDEPFASIDSTLRRQLREDTRRALRQADVPAIVVTHDAQEAMELADRIAVMGRGEIVQMGTPEQIWQHPADRFVAELFGDTDAVSGRIVDAGIETEFGLISMLPPGDVGTACEVIVRRRAVQMTAAQNSQAVVEDIRFLGERYLVVVQAKGQYLRADTSAEPPVQRGDRVHLSFDSTDVLVYFPTTD
ncbi:MAG: ABC transporter ATP-binding protein [Pseudomonadota bacterium]